MNSLNSSGRVDARTQSTRNAAQDFSLVELLPTWVLAAVCFAPIAVMVASYVRRRRLDARANIGTAMSVSEIYIYPIKSLREVKVKEALATPYGFKHDRSFMLLKKDGDSYVNMAVPRYPEMTQFLQEFKEDGFEKETLTVKYIAYGNADKARTISIPLTPNTENLAPFDVKMHDSPTSAFKMPTEYNTWFSECFGFDVVLIYLGDNKRAVLFQDMLPRPRQHLVALATKLLPFAKSLLPTLSVLQQPSHWKITFADCAPYLITSKTSLHDVSARLPDGESMDMTKFRPNIVVAGAEEAYQEDYWGRIQINGRVEIIMAHNCKRCVSVNIDYQTGKPGTGASGEILKRLSKDRRVDLGSKWCSVFGRYSFWDPACPSQVIRVGDGVRVVEMNKARTAWNWPNL